MFLSAIYVLCVVHQARAGVPYSTDDAGTPTKGHYEINIGSQLTTVSDDTSGTLLGVEVNYGVTERVEAHVLVPLAFDRNGSTGSTVGLGDSELGFKYRFIDDDEHGWMPDIGVAPTLVLPSGSEARYLGTGHVHGVLPLVFGKALGRWIVFASAGYAIDPGAGRSDGWLAGIGAAYALTPKWGVGLEVFHTQSVSGQDPAVTDLCVGVTYTLNDTHHPMISVGRGIQNVQKTNEVSVFVGDQVLF